MPVDKFGRFSHRPPPRGPRGERGIAGPPGDGFLKTENGDFDINWKHLKNISEPLDDSDAATKKYVDIRIQQIKTIPENEIRDYFKTNKIISKEEEIAEVKAPQ